MSGLTKLVGTFAIATLAGTSAFAGGLAGAAVESEPFVVEETEPAGTLGGATPLLILGAVALAAIALSDSSDGTD